MVVHCPFEEMTEAFRTQEDSASSKAEEKNLRCNFFGADPLVPF